MSKRLCSCDDTDMLCASIGGVPDDVECRQVAHVMRQVAHVMRLRGLVNDALYPQAKAKPFCDCAGVCNAGDREPTHVMCRQRAVQVFDDRNIVHLHRRAPFAGQLQGELRAVMDLEKFGKMSAAEVVGVLEFLKWDVINGTRE